MIEEGHVRTDPLDVGKDMGGKQDRRLFPDGQEEVQDLLAAYRIQGGGGLVADQQLRPVQPSCDKEDV